MARRPQSKIDAKNPADSNRLKGEEYLVREQVSNSDCEHKPCRWLLTQTEEPRRNTIYIEMQDGSLTDLAALGDSLEELVRTVLWYVKRDHPPGLVEELVGNCGKGCKCWKTEPDPKEDDWPKFEPVSWEGNVIYQPSGSSGPTHTYKAQGTIYKRKTTVSGICDSIDGTPSSPDRGSDC